MENDDKVRSGKGVVVSLRDMGNGTSRLFFDDVAPDRDANPNDWSHQSFYTFTPEFENAALDSMALFPSQLQGIGAAVVARLLALNGRTIEEQDDPGLHEDDEIAIAALGESDLATIDGAILARCEEHWRKVAYIVGSAMMDMPERFDRIPDLFYAVRVRALVEAGLLEAQGNLRRMRFSEVRRKAKPTE